jgi:DNA-binding SARP family transcriptional activator
VLDATRRRNRGCRRQGRGGFRFRQEAERETEARDLGSGVKTASSHGVPEALGDDLGALVRRGRYELDVVGDLRAARACFELAFRMAQRDGDHEGMAEAALGVGGVWVYEQRGAGIVAGTMSMQRQALAVVRPDSVLAIRLRARLAAEADYHVGEHSRVLESLTEARRHGDAQAVASALSLAHQCLLGPEHGSLRHDLAEELLLTAVRTGRPMDRLMGVLWRTVDRFLDGDPHAERSLSELSDTLRQQRHQAVGFATEAMRVMLKIRAGDFDRAEAMAADCARRGEACGDADAPIWHRGHLLAIRWFQGRVGELLPTVRQEAHSPGLGPVDDSHFATLATIAAGEGDHRLAAGALARLGRGDLTRIPSSSSWLVTLYGAVEAAAELGDAETAARAYHLLHPHARLPVVGGLGVVCFGSVEHALGVASLTFGDADRAVAHLRAAVRGNLALGHWPAACLSRHRLIQALTLRGHPGDEREAAGELATAHRERTQLGMKLPRTRPHVIVEAATPARPANDASAAQVRLLGPVDLTVGGSVREVSGLRRQAVLAVLALHGGDVIGTDQLIDIVWGDHPPITATNTLQSHVSHLRRLFGTRVAILARAPGYVLNLDGDATDVTVAERLIGLGTAAADPAERVRHFQAAVRLWRGRALMGLSGSRWLEGEAERLDQLLVHARQALARARLDLGQHAQALGDLEALAREHPLYEQTHGALMLALYRCGRQGDALGVYQRLRVALRDDLGVEPSQPLRDLEAAVLRQDGDLYPPEARNTSVA